MTKNTVNPALETLLSSMQEARLVRSSDGRVYSSADEERTKLATQWLNQAENNFDFETLKNRILTQTSDTSSTTKLDLMFKWLSRNNSLENLKEIILLAKGNSFQFAKEYERMYGTSAEYLVEKWLKEPNNAPDFETLNEHILPLVNSKTRVLKEWIIRPVSNSIENVIKILPLLKGEDLIAERISLLERWISSRAQVSYDDIKAILPHLETKYEKSKFVDIWIARIVNFEDHSIFQTLSFADLQNIISLSEQNKEIAIVAWLKEPNNNIDFESLNSQMTSISSIYNREAILKTWIAKPQNNNLENLRKIISAHRNAVLYDILPIFFRANKIDFETLERELLSAFSFSEEYKGNKYKEHILVEWIKLNNVDFEFLRNRILPLCQSNDVLQIWAQKPENYDRFRDWLLKDGNNVDGENTLSVITFALRNDGNNAADLELENIWQGKPANNGESLKELEKSLTTKFLFFSRVEKKEVDKVNAVKKFLEKPENNIADLEGFGTKILSHFEDERTKFLLLRLWMSKPENATAYNLESALTLLKEKPLQIEIALEWLRRPGHGSLSNLINILSLFEKDADVVEDSRVIFMKRWLTEPENNAKIDPESIQIISARFDSLKRQNILEALLETAGGNVLENLKAILPQLPKEKASPIAKAWFKSSEDYNNPATFVEVLSVLGDYGTMIFRNELATDWLQNSEAGRNIDVKTLAEILKGKEWKYEIARIWLGIAKNSTIENLKAAVDLGLTGHNFLETGNIVNDFFKVGNNGTMQNLKEVLSWENHNINRFSVVMEWMRLPGNNTADNFKEIRSLIEVSPIALTTILPIFEDEDNRRRVLDILLDNSANSTAFSNFKEALNSLRLIDDKPKVLSFAKLWSDRLKDYNPDNLKEACSLLEDNHPAKDDYINYVATTWSNWLQKSGKNVSPDELGAMLPQETWRKNVIMTWLSMPENNSLENLKKIIDPQFVQGKFFFNGEVHTIVNHFLATGDNGTIESLQEILSWNNFNVNKITVETSWLRLPQNNNFDNFKKLCALSPRTEYDLIDLIRSFVIADDGSLKYEALINVLNSGLFDKYNTTLVARICNNLPSAGTALDIDDFVKICGDIYPTTDILKADLATAYALHTRANQKYPADYGIMIFQKIIPKLDDDAALYAASQMRDIFANNIREIDILNIVKDRLHSRYESVSNLLFLPLQESLTPEGLRTVENAFGKENVNSITLAGLFSYFDINQNTEQLTKLIKPAVINNIRGKFKPSDKKPYIDGKEFEKLEVLIGSNFNLPKTALLCDYLTKQVVVPELTSAVIDQCNLDFTDTILEIITKDPEAEISEAEKERNEKQLKTQKEANELFKTILRSNPISEDDALNFLVLLQPDLVNSISAEGKSKLVTAFTDHRSELACLLAKKGGLAKFLVAVPSLSDGCVKNIGNQVTIAVFSSLIEDPALQVAYSLAVQQIMLPILNSGGDVILNEKSPFANKTIRGSVISPHAFLVGLRREFVNDAGKIQRKSWEFLPRLMGDEILETFGELNLDPEQLNNKMIDLSCYLILKRCAESEAKITADKDQRFFSKVFNDQSLQEFRTSNQETLKKLDAVMEKQKKEEADAAKAKSKDKGSSSKHPDKKESSSSKTPSAKGVKNPLAKSANSKPIIGEQRDTRS